MKFLPYVLKHLRRNWIRTGSTVMAMAVCIFLFCTLQTIIAAVNYGLKSASASRLVTRHSISLVYNMPMAYKERIAQIPGVKRVAISNWFGGVMGLPPDFTKFFANFAVEPEDYLAMYPEYVLDDADKAAFFADRRGAIIGPGLAERFGWSVGSTVQLESTIPPYRIGKPFEFVIRGIYKLDEDRYPGTDGGLFFFHHKYLQEATGRASAGTFGIEVEDPERAGAVAKAVDAFFENSDVRTKTETEAAFRAGFVSLAGNLALLLNGIGIAVTFTILLVTANTMSMAVRERRTEIAVLKTLGFGSGLVMALILVESLVLGVMGGGLGLVLGGLMIGVLPSLPLIGDVVRAFPNLGLQPTIALLGFSIAVFLGLAAGVLPALQAYRARITDTLRTV
ncbi:MAG: FtsX-like permease family protein [Vicinamibacteria bacterium]|jgi:putative ABC transport system permease protein|nr:FtsX-like permease family protein [Vicinamibacteria bacterium]